MKTKKNKIKRGNDDGISRHHESIMAIVSGFPPSISLITYSR
jgi:hypothetical protein